jgi:hypothetical protein
MSMGTSAGPGAVGGQFAEWGVGERVAGCEFRHRGCGTDQMPDAQKGTNQTMVAFGSVCMNRPVRTT